MMEEKKMEDENKRLVRLNYKVNTMTLWNLRKLAKMSNCGDNIGKMIDKLVREKMISLRIMRENNFSKAYSKRTRKNCSYCYKDFCVSNCVNLKDDSMCYECTQFRKRK